MQNISNNYTNLEYTCPKCGAQHSMRRHGFYDRHVLTFEKDTFHDHTLAVLRLQCTSCNTTHALLPYDTIPYCIYSLTTFLQITAEVLINDKTLSHTAQQFNLSYQLIAFFVIRLLSFENQCRLLFKELQHFDSLSLSDMLRLIMTRPTFASDYFIHTRWLFLMQKFRFISPRPIFIGSNLS